MTGGALVETILRALESTLLRWRVCRSDRVEGRGSSDRPAEPE